MSKSSSGMVGRREKMDQDPDMASLGCLQDLQADLPTVLGEASWKLRRQCAVHQPPLCGLMHPCRGFIQTLKGHHCHSSASSLLSIIHFSRPIKWGLRSTSTGESTGCHPLNRTFFLKARMCLQVVHAKRAVFLTQRGAKRSGTWYSQPEGS